MASATRGSMGSSSDPQNSASVSSMAWRSTGERGETTSGTKVVDPENSVGRLAELLESRLRFRERGGRGTQLGDPFLEQCERCVELELVALQLCGDFLEPLHAFLEAHESPLAAN